MRAQRIMHNIVEHLLAHVVTASTTNEMPNQLLVPIQPRHYKTFFFRAQCFPGTPEHHNLEPSQSMASTSDMNEEDVATTIKHCYALSMQLRNYAVNYTDQP